VVQKVVVNLVEKLLETVDLSLGELAAEEPFVDASGDEEGFALGHCGHESLLQGREV
jgi:hypothetical protein